MKRLLSFIVVLLLLCSSCQEKKPALQEIAPPNKVITTQPVDTVFETQYLYTDADDHRKEQHEFRAGNDVYKAFTESYSLNDSSLLQVVPDSVDGKLIGYKALRCHNHVYKIRLAKNGKLLYQKQFTKLDFLKLEDDGFIKECAPLAPSFRGVTADGKALFDIWFGLPDSDYGGISFFATDLKGNLLQLQSYSSTGGNGCDGQVSVSPNRLYYLSCHELYGPGGYRFKFGKADMVAARFLTDTSFVAIYDYVRRYYDPQKKDWQEERDDKTNNLIIYHVNGRKLASHKYDGFTLELDYQAPIEVVKEQGVLLLFDDQKKVIQTITFANPQSVSAIKLASLTELPKRKTEANWTETPEIYGEKRYWFYLAADTVKAYYASTHKE